MLTKRFVAFLAVGLAVATLGVLVTLHVTRGARMELKGSVLKVRTMAQEDKSTLLFADFRFENTAHYRFVVRTVEVHIEDAAGQMVEGAVMSDSHAKTVFEYYKLLGPKYSDSLQGTDKIEPRQKLDRMIGARFEIPEAQLAARKRLIIRITEEARGEVSEIVQ